MVFYLLIAGWSPTVNAAILLALAVLVFVPHPLRLPVADAALAVPTNVAGVVWGVLML